MDKFDNYEKRKKIIFLIIFVIVIVFIFGIGFLLFKNEVFGSRKYLIVGNHLIFNKTNDGFVQIKPDDVFKNSNFTVFNDMTSFKSDRAEYRDGWRFYGGKKVVSTEDYRLAYSGFSSIKLADYSLLKYDVNDEKLVLNIANTDDDIDYEIFRNSLRKVNFDFDSDGSFESLYVMSDFVVDNGNRTPYSYMFSVKDDEVVDSIFEIDKNFYHIIDIIDIDNDGIYEIIVSKGAFPEEDFDSCYQMYNMKKGNITLVHDCNVS